MQRLPFVCLYPKEIHFKFGGTEVWCASGQLWDKRTEGRKLAKFFRLPFMFAFSIQFRSFFLIGKIIFKPPSSFTQWEAFSLFERQKLRCKVLKLLPASSRSHGSFNFPATLPRGKRVFNLNWERIHSFPRRDPLLPSPGNWLWKFSALFSERDDSLSKQINSSAAFKR